MTLPALMTNVSQAKIGPALAKFTNTMENGIRQYMFEQEVGKLTTKQLYYKCDEGAKQHGCKDNTYPIPVKTSSQLVAQMSPYIIWASPDEKSLENYKVMFNDGTVYSLDFTPHSPDDTANANNSVVKVLKDGGIAIFKNADLNTMNNDEAAEDAAGLITMVFYDINGFQKPNTLGKDIFVFYLDKQGILVPYGSAMHRAKTNIPYPTCDPASSKFEFVASCTGKVADNGWKANF